MPAFDLPLTPPIQYKWRCVADSEGPETNSFDAGDSQATMLIDVDLTNPSPPGVTLPQVIADIIGYPSVYWPTAAQIQAAGQAGFTAIASLSAGGTGGVLSRKLPWQHPRFPWMWAMKIGSVQGRQFKAKKWSTVPLVSFGGSLTAGGGVSIPFSEYGYYRINILFTIPPYNVLSDAQVGTNPANLIAGEEWNRFVSIEADTGEENISRPGSTLRWSRIGGSLPFGQAAVNGIPFGMIVRTPKIMYTWTWHNVPGWGLLGPKNWGTPKNLIRGIGKVNSSFWPGDAVSTLSSAPPYTLLFLKPKWIPENAPVDPTRLGIGSGFNAYTSYSPRTYKVLMPVVYFDPDPNPGMTADNRPWPRPGHNGAPNPSDGYFYFVTTDRINNVDSNVNHLYRVYDFWKLFSLNYPGGL